MKNKKVTQAVMLLFVLGVWGVIFYKIYDKLRGDEPEAPAFDMPTDKISAQHVADTFRLMANYNDPFEHKSMPVREAGNEAARNTPAVTVKKDIKPLVAAAMPQIKYLGMIKNNSSKKAVALISINGKSSLMQENESVDQVKLLKLLKDSVLVLVDKQKIFVRK